MSEIRLIPYSDLDAEQLGRDFYELVRDHQVQLHRRHLFGVIARYGVSAQTAVVNVQKGQADMDPQHFAVFKGQDELMGSASIYKYLRLFQQQLALPSSIAKRINESHLVVTMGPNVHAWTSDSRLLGAAYKELVSERGGNGSWTIEPIHSGIAIHREIAAAGLHRHAAARYDDGESSRQVPPKSFLYTAD